MFGRGPELRKGTYDRMALQSALKRVAATGIAGGESAPQPSHALLGRPVSEGLRLNRATRHLLHAIVAYRRCGAQTLFDVSGL